MRCLSVMISTADDTRLCCEGRLCLACIILFTTEHSHGAKWNQPQKQNGGGGTSAV